VIEVVDARRKLLAEVAPLPTESVALAEAHGRTLAEEIRADRDFPATDRSAMDGFAVRSTDAGEPGASLRILGELRAGVSPRSVRVDPGGAVRIFTGGVVPEGADAVVMVELVEEDRDAGTVTVRQSVEAGQNIRRRAEDIREGETVLRPGSWIGAAEVAALASVGRTTVRVGRRPRVHVLSTGDELVDASRTPAAHEIRNSNAPMLSASLAEMGIPATDLGIAADRDDALAAALARGLEGDLLLVTGGVSMGEYDLVGRELERAGMRRIFHRVAMKPGKPILAGRRGACLVLGLPGNPVSAFTGFRVFAVPVLLRMCGAAGWEDRPVRAVLAERLRRRPGRKTYHLGRVDLADSPPSARPVRTMSSGDVLSMSAANAFLVTEASPHALEPGSTVEALLWPGFDRR